MLHISVAMHFCGGKETASLVSLSGKLSDCGMEETKESLPASGTNFTNHCCDNFLTICGTDSNYAPSFSFVPETIQYNFHVYASPAEAQTNTISYIIPSYTSVSPPGGLLTSSVDLSGICVFRI